MHVTGLTSELEMAYGKTEDIAFTDFKEHTNSPIAPGTSTEPSAPTIEENRPCSHHTLPSYETVVSRASNLDFVDFLPKKNVYLSEHKKGYERFE